MASSTAITITSAIFILATSCSPLSICREYRFVPNPPEEHTSDLKDKECDKIGNHRLVVRQFPKRLPDGSQFSSCCGEGVLHGIYNTVAKLHRYAKVAETVKIVCKRLISNRHRCCLGQYTQRGNNTFLLPWFRLQARYLLSSPQIPAVQTYEKSRADAEVMDLVESATAGRKIIIVKPENDAGHKDDRECLVQKILSLLPHMQHSRLCNRYTIGRQLHYKGHAVS